MDKNEHMQVPIQDISYEKYIEVLLEKIHHRHIHYKIIGKVVSERTDIEYPIYR